MPNVRQRQPRADASACPPAFAEAPAWQSVGSGWRPLFGSFRDLGFSFEWHDFTCAQELNWARSFHPGSIELCLNLDGVAAISDGRLSVELGANTFTYYHQGIPPLTASRRANQRHRFITVEFAPAFLEHHFGRQAENLHPLVRTVVRPETPDSQVVPPERMSTALLHLIDSLRNCPVFKPAQEVSFRCKALEVAAQLFFRPPAGEFFCTWRNGPRASGSNGRGPF